MKKIKVNKDKVKSILADGRRIDAIKFVINSTKCSLADALRYVKSLEAGR